MWPTEGALMAKSDIFENTHTHTHTHKCNEDPGGTLALLGIISKLLALNSLKV